MRQVGITIHWATHVIITPHITQALIHTHTHNDEVLIHVTAPPSPLRLSCSSPSAMLTSPPSTTATSR